MPTRKDKTNVAPIHREQVFIPASGATLLKQQVRPKVAGRPVSSGAIEIVSPEFDLLTGVRGLLNMSKPNKVYANIGNGSNTTMFDGATTTSEAVKQGIKEARDYVRHPVIVETVERNKELAERISGKPARNMGWFTDGNRVPANTRAEVLQHYIDRPVHIQTSNDLPKGFLGDYTSANTRIRVKSGLSPYDTKRVTFHEGLHHSGYGNFEGGLYDLKAEKLFGIDDYLLGHEAAVNTAELGRMMGLELGQKYPGFQTFKDMIAKYNVDGFDKKFIFDKAILNTPRDYKRFWDALTGKYFTTAGAAATGLNLTNTDKMKCGGRRKAQLGLDIREGGIAIPIAPNMYYMDGRSHDNGGIAIGPNNKNGLEVEGGEVVKVGNKDIKVFSSVPLLRGVSPAQLVLGGVNPNKVFKAQEEFKDRNRINDDGTRYEIGGEKKSNSAIRTEEDKKVSARNRAIYSAVDATADYPTWWQAIGLGIGSNFKTIINPDSMNYTVTDSVADAAWRKRLGLSYNDKFLVSNKDGSVRLPRNVEREIPTDTTMLKKRIAANEKFVNQSNIVGEDWQIVQAMMKKDKEALEALRKTYKTGEPVVVNEYAHNNRKLSKNGELIDDAINYKSPLNVMKNYTIQYDPKTRKMNYWDTYDFNEFDWGVPGESFKIKGSIPLKKFGGNMIYTINGNVKNGLSLRPKAKMGKEEKIDDKTKIGEDGLIYKRGTDGNWYTDGTLHASRRKITSNKNIKQHSSKSSTPTTLKKVNFTSPLIQGERKKIGNLYYEQTENGQWKPTANQSSVTTRNSGKPVDFGMTRIGVNHPNSKYTYHPLTGEKINADGIVETEEPSVKGTTKVNTQSNSTPRGGESKSDKTSRGTAKVESPKPATATNPNEARYASTIKPAKKIEAIAGDEKTNQSVKAAQVVDGYRHKVGENQQYEDNSPDKYRYTRAAGFKNEVNEVDKVDKTNETKTSPTGDGTQSKDGRWVGQYKTTNVGDWIGLGSNLAGSVASYFMTKSAIDKMPEPLKPIMAQPVKLKTKYNIEPQLTDVRETEQMNRASVRRNTQSSNTSLAREQRLMNEARGARNTLYGQKENIETKLINQDRLNRQSVMRDSVKAYNEYLNKLTATKTAQTQLKVSNINNLISGLTGSVNSILGNIESRRATNNTLRAIAAANPNVDARLIGGFDYYIDPITKKKYNKNQQYVGTING